MNWKKVFLWSLALVVALALMSVVRLGNTQEYYQFQDAFNSLAPGQTIWLSDGVEMKQGVIFLWVLKEKGLSRPYLVFFNTCTHIPFELTSVHDNSVAHTDVTVCNIMGNVYYWAPIIS